MSQQQPAPEVDPALDEVLAGYRQETSGGDTDYLREVAKVANTEVGVAYLSEMQSEFARANVLANRSEAETYEAKWLIRFRTNQFFMEHPPAGSKMTGELRQLVYGNQNQPISPAQEREILAIEQILIARVTQSRNMEQQRIIKEMRQDQHLSREDTSRGGSFSDKIRDAFR